MYAYCHLIVDIILYSSWCHCRSYRSRNNFSIDYYDNTKHAQYRDAKGKKLSELNVLCMFSPRENKVGKGKEKKREREAGKQKDIQAYR